MPHSNVSSSPATTASCPSPDPRPSSAAVAIHQPNLFPRLSTLAKLYAADVRIVLDDVQFTRRDYQHRARLGQLGDPACTQWLSLAAHLPAGRATVIGEALVAEPERSRRRLALLIEQYYRHSRYWPAVARVVDATLTAFDATGRIGAVAEASTTALLDELCWSGQTMLSSDLPSGNGRSERLGDLAGLVGATTYLCGTGGMSYLEPEYFTSRNIGVIPFRTPAESTGEIWASARRISALWALATVGPQRLTQLLSAVAAFNRGLFDLRPPTTY
ncbi:WbqC family protein [Catenulispora pinistramenti]|uniref:WbqC family protein n=1 Tax=Catenulispora pinistramenti TaxID=2705254 RepID=UPI001E58D238|nr:WbqC family protein [Catenulispora pinistramenti]